MRSPPKFGSPALPNSGWICPITRIRKELGMDFFWTARGPVIGGGKLKEPIVGIEINSSPYITRDQFQCIRWALQQSHQNDRRAATIYCGIHGEEVAAQNRARATTESPSTYRTTSSSSNTARSQGTDRGYKRATESRMNSPVGSNECSSSGTGRTSSSESRKSSLRKG